MSEPLEGPEHVEPDDPQGFGPDRPDRIEPDDPQGFGPDRPDRVQPDHAQGFGPDRPDRVEPDDPELTAIAEGELGADGEIRAVANPGGAPRSGPAQIVEALLFLAPDPLTLAELAEAARLSELEVDAALATLAERYAPGTHGIVLRQLGGGFTFASDPGSEDAARRLFSRPRVATLSPAQAETLAIVAYLQPVSRPEITRIRGVSADSATTTLLERGLIEQHGRSQYGAATYRTTMLFMKLFGLRSLDDLPDIARWDPTPAEQAQLYERLMRAGDARAGGGPTPE
ncbi:MAG TPA: SMC-Scp complex subunit ScpB [Solirubrobacteraceae bacterium]|nr:SMC-Scp complex subunit ScpB [Solirubrobacteraceae bacterium]